MTIDQILIKRHLLINEDTQTNDGLKTVAYYNAYLLSNFGIVVDKPDLLTLRHIWLISDFYKLNVPDSFYKNPQDTKYYSKGELFVEQVLSYMLAYGEEDSHVKVFKKDLQDYPIGSEITLRKFKILSSDEAAVILTDIVKDYCIYTRPWSLDEYNEFITLYNLGFYKDYEISCGDNAITMLEKDINFAHFLFKKDLVKISVARCGEYSKLVLDSTTKDLIRKAIPLVKDCSMTKKQAKYFNTLIAKVGAQGKVKKATNASSPYAKAKTKLDAGDVLGAAKIYAASGSLLERNLKMLISRADPQTALNILDLLPAKNPLVLYQMMSTLMTDNGEARTFTFSKNRLVKKHIETEYEQTWRKSKLNNATRKLIHDKLLEKISKAYDCQEKIGSVYIDNNFFKVAIPTNTSMSGKGIDVPPIGTRIKIHSPFIRTFVHWEDAFDIDSSLIITNKDNSIQTMSYSSYYYKEYGDNILFSGDVTSPTGTEYYDIRLNELKKEGVKYIIQTFHGFRSTLNAGKIYCGYQNKEDLNTEAWDPKNIALKMHVKGETRAFMSFAIDVQNSELIVLNTLLDEKSQVVSGSMKKIVDKYLSPNYLELNIGRIATIKSNEITIVPETADVVFSDTYGGKEGQLVVRSYDVEKLVKLIN